MGLQEDCQNLDLSDVRKGHVDLQQSELQEFISDKHEVNS